MSEPRITPLAKPIRVPTPDTRWVRTPSAMNGHRPFGCGTGFVELRPIDSRRVELLRRGVQRLVSHHTDLTRLLDHAADGRDHDADHDREQSEHDDTGGERRPEPMALQHIDRWSEDDGQDRRERHREHDLAHGRECARHDDPRQHESDEAPRPHTEPGNPNRTPLIRNERRPGVADGRPVTIRSVLPVRRIGRTSHTTSVQFLAVCDSGSAGCVCVAGCRRSGQSVSIGLPVGSSTYHTPPCP